MSKKIDFRSRAEIAEDNRRELVAQQDHKQALEQMTQRVEGRLAQLEQRSQALASQGTQANQEISALNDDISKVHAMIRAGAESDMQMIEQMNRNHERRLNSLIGLIKDI